MAAALAIPETGGLDAYRRLGDSMPAVAVGDRRASAERPTAPRGRGRGGGTAACGCGGVAGGGLTASARACACGGGGGSGGGCGGGRAGRKGGGGIFAKHREPDDGC